MVSDSLKALILTDIKAVVEKYRSEGHFDQMCKREINDMLEELFKITRMDFVVFGYSNHLFIP